jgi:hypothetical protein
MVSAVALAQGFNNIRERLTGYEEVSAVSTTGNGTFQARIRQDAAIEWQLRYADLEGTVQQSHIHFAQEGVNGDIVVFLCTNLGNGPAGTQACPAPPAVVSGIITEANIGAGAAARGIEAGNLEEFIAAIRAGRTYVNVHSTKWPAGEIRSQLHNNGNH